jgi:hypothetical protein
MPSLTNLVTLNFESPIHAPTTRLHVELSLLFPFAFGLVVLPVVRGSSPLGVLLCYLVHHVVVLDSMSIFDD